MADDFDLIDYTFTATFSVDPEFMDPDDIARYIQDMLYDMLQDGYPFGPENIKPAGNIMVLHRGTGTYFALSEAEFVDASEVDDL